MGRLDNSVFLDQTIPIVNQVYEGLQDIIYLFHLFIYLSIYLFIIYFDLFIYLFIYLFSKISVIVNNLCHFGCIIITI